MQLLEPENSIDYKLAVMEFIPNNSINFSKVINNGTPLAILKKNEGKNTYIIIATMIAKFCASFNVVRNMTPEQINEYAFVLVEENMYGSLPENPSYRLEDLAVFFERAKTGKYGQPYDHIDSAVIEKMLDKYHEERVAEYHRTKFINEEPVYTQLSEEQIKKTNKTLNTLIEKAIEYEKIAPKENSLAKQELIKLELAVAKNIEFYGKEHYENAIKFQEKDILDRIEKLKKQIKLEENGEISQ